MGRKVALVLGIIAIGLCGVVAPAAAFQCNDCHGQSGTTDLRPLDAPYRNITTGGFQGNHRSHMSAAATVNNCAVCHQGSQNYTNDHRNGLISLSPAINGSRKATSYKNRTTAFPQTADPVFGMCTNVNCHFEKDTPSWGSLLLPQPQACGVCHGAPPADGGHPATAGSGKKHGDYLGTDTNSCRHCHPDHSVAPDPFSHATSAGKRALTIQFTTLPNSGGSYSGDVSYPTYLDNADRTGTCSGIYCHSNGAPFDKANETRTPTWGGTLTCSDCHAAAGGQTGLSGRHGKHTDPAGYGYSCEKCHRDTVNGSDTINDKTLHVNAAKDVTFSSGGAYNSEIRGCSNTYCHSNALGGAPTTSVRWSDTEELKCYSCHKGRTADNNATDCIQPIGLWDGIKQLCSPYINITTNGHNTLVGPQWIRQYPCHYCHNATVGTDGKIKDKTRHVNQQKDVEIAPQWAIIGRPAPTYDAETKVCDNLYCHSDGTSTPEIIRPLSWTSKEKTKCNSCHGHPQGTCSSNGCHDGRTDANGKTWTVRTGWAPGEEWKESMPVYVNQGPGTSRANSHARHMQTNFTCDNCHDETIRNGLCTDCHNSATPSGTMRETSHINAQRHVNKSKDVVFKNNSGVFIINPQNNNKTCSNTKCHRGGADPVWGGSVNTTILCINCHGTADSDVDDFSPFNGKQAKINLTEFNTTGHGRSSALGPYPWSGNPAADFPGNPCWYCHDNSVLHKDGNNPFRLRQHGQYQKQFDQECVYCHMEGNEAECLNCHNSSLSLAPQLSTISGSQSPYRPSHTSITSGCLSAGCHDTDETRHKTGAGLWTAEQKSDVKNAYVMMGVCLKCHDDDSGGRCTSCHNSGQYSIGFDPGTGLIKAQKSKATSMHFGYKHYRSFLSSGGWSKDANGKVIGTWKGGKFCWDCHDPHGDSNIYMMQSKVATATDGRFGIPAPGARADVVFTQKVSGSDYAKVQDPQNPVAINGICNVCHDKQNKQHYHKDGGDSHNSGRICTSCHEHRFTDSHASKQSCNTCHKNKSVPRHNAFGLPRDCTKCHNGAVGGRIDVVGQLKGTSHHIQGVAVNNKHCYACHWEATSQGLIDVNYHAGYNYKLYTSVKKQASDLVIWGPGTRPAGYRTYSTAEGRATVQRFLATNVSFGILSTERKEVNKLTTVCLSCHSDQNNDTEPFGDCKTPRQYAWDRQSVAARYSQTGTTTWGKYAATPGASKKNQVKALSAHGNAVNNAGGGWDTTPASESGAETGTGNDGSLTNSRGGAYNVACYDCHSSHGSKLVGVTSSYPSLNGQKNGGNLKETVAGKGGYMNNYKAADNITGINPYSAGAGQCFDCHESAAPGTQTRNGKTPWGYSSTFGATSPILGYKDTSRFGQGMKASTARFAYRNSKQTIIGGHMKASEPNGSLPHLAKETGIAGGGTTSTIDDAKGWLADKWKNYYALITSGANSGQARKITGNTATTLTFEPFGNSINAGDSYQIVPYAASVDGLCTPCHDPHGVSPILGANQAYATPLLKGTWLTSPYKEDYAATAPFGNNITSSDGKPRSWGKYLNPPSPTQPYVNYNTDRNTFGGANNRMTESAEQFAGLCVTCHKKEVLTDGINKNQSWKSTDRLHESVKGWGANTEHSYSCSKCHQPHNSGLPRLMVTNCLDVSHRGKKTAGGVPWAADRQDGSAHWQGQHRGYPVGNIYNNAAGDGEALTACHLRRSNLPANPWPNENQWNNVTPW